MMKRAFALWIVLLFACVHAPYSNRSQFILISSSQERALGVQAYQETLSKSKVMNSGSDTELVRKVGKRIAPIADESLRERNLQPFEWEFNVIQEKTVNAWCLPGGKVAFYSGIIPVCQNEAGIATVMGHEIGHAIARHGAERMTTSMGVEFISGVLDVGFQRSKPETKEAILSLYGVGANLGSLAFSRNQESEADQIGLMLMARAGYNPSEAVSFWERMQAQSKGAPPEFLSTHPSDATRIANLKKLLPEAMKFYKP